MVDANPLLAAALEHAQAGRPVFPLHYAVSLNTCSCRLGAGCGSIGKHPQWDRDDLPNGCKNATLDPALVQRWWDRWPRANIGIATGRAAGFWVLDVDPKHGGEETLAMLEKQHGKLPHTVEALTGGGGRHVFFAWVEGIPNEVGSRDRALLGDGLDTRSDGGLIVAPGSIHANSKQYEWEGFSDPSDTAFAPAPEWLIAKLQGKMERPPFQAPETITEGGRNRTLFEAAASMRAKSLAAREIEAALQVMNEDRCRPPLPRDEVAGIAESAGRYAPGSGLWETNGKGEDGGLQGIVAATEQLDSVAQLQKANFVSIQPLTVINSDPKLFLATVNGQQIELKAQQFTKWDRFKDVVIQRLCFVPVLPEIRGKKELSPQIVYEQYVIGPALRHATHVEAPEDAGAGGAIWEAIRAFIRAVRQHEGKEHVYEYRLVRADGWIWFRGEMLRRWLERNRRRNIEEDDLWNVFRKHGGLPCTVNVKRRPCAAWKIPESALEEVMPNDPDITVGITDISHENGGCNA